MRANLGMPSSDQQSNTKTNTTPFWTEGQYCGKMLAETGSFDILFVYWVLGIGFFHIYINIYTYIHIHLVLGIYIIENGRLKMM